MSKTLRKLGDLAGALRNRKRLASAGTTRTDLLLLQRQRLVWTARHAAANSPLYRELYAGTELTENLDPRALPVVSKAMLMERFDEWVTDPRLRLSKIETHLEHLNSDDLYLGEYRCMTTAGTTGLKGVFVYNSDEWRECLVAFLRWSELMGLRPRVGRRVRVATVGAVSPLHMSARFGLSFELALYAGCALDARMPLRQLVAALNDHRPDHLIGYPSMVSLLAVEQMEGRLRIAPGVVGTTGEVRTEEMSRHIRSAWEIEPFDIYGTTEALYAGDCEQHLGMHVFEDLGLVEVVDERGNPVPDGVVGAKLLITSFIKRTQPLIRYELSDLAALTTTPCPCGRPLARMVSVQGRSDDVLALKGRDGRIVSVHPLTIRSPMAAFTELREYQVVQDDTGLHVRIVLSDRASKTGVAERVAATLLEQLRTVEVADDRLDVTVVAALPRSQGPSGKFKLIESRVSSAKLSSATAH